MLSHLFSVTAGSRELLGNTSPSGTHLGHMLYARQDNPGPGPQLAKAPGYIVTSTCGTLFTPLQSLLEARPVVHATEQPLEAGPFLLYGKQLELREGRSLIQANSSTGKARDTGKYEWRDRTNAQGHLGRTPQSSVEGGEMGG